MVCHIEFCPTLWYNVFNYDVGNDRGEDTDENVKLKRIWYIQKIMTYIISDIHGEYELFCRLLEKMKFAGSDTLICCGDMIEKGDRSVQLTKLLFSMKNTVLLAGNHEYAFLKYYWSLMRETEDYDLVLRKLQEYFPYDGALLDWDTVDRMEALPYFYETEEYICVHAGVPLDERGNILPLKQASPERLVYDRMFKEPDILPSSNKCVFFGHTPTINLGFEPKIKCYLREGARGGKISDYYKIHLDTGVYHSGVLGCFCVEECREFYVCKSTF